MSNKILIVDDEIDLLEILAYNLIKAGYEVEQAETGEEALEKLENQKDQFSLILLDVMMPGINGFETAERIIDEGWNVPIIFLTALGQESNLLHGFSLGADDYIAKPFSVKEVVARIGAVIRRRTERISEKKNEPVGKITIDNVILDSEEKMVYVDNSPVKFTKTEFMLLETLMQNPKRIFSRQDLLEKVWSDSVFVGERTVDVHIARIRKKLDTAGDIIQNRSGYGYSINSEK